MNLGVDREAFSVEGVKRSIGSLQMKCSQILTRDQGEGELKGLVEIRGKRKTGITAGEHRCERAVPDGQRDLARCESLYNIFLLSGAIIAKEQAEIKRVFLRALQRRNPPAIHKILDLSLDGLVVDVVRFDVLIFFRAVKFEL